jgi:hypothetical protein
VSSPVSTSVTFHGSTAQLCTRIERSRMSNVTSDACSA